MPLRGEVYKEITRVAPNHQSTSPKRLFQPSFREGVGNRNGDLVCSGWCAGFAAASDQLGGVRKGVQLLLEGLRSRPITPANA